MPDLDARLLASTDPNDFGRFYERQLPAVAAYVGARTTRPDIAFDLIAETFARALAGRRGFDPARGPAVAWLLGIARNLIVDSQRRGQVAADARERLGLERIELEDRQLLAIESMMGADLRSALESLPQEQREAVIRRVLGDESYTTIADNVGCSPQVARKRVSRGLATLRRRMEGSV
jgi:RNA polymerase sigma-70 factor (ECF subfamily)